ncbi:MAG TPA: 3-isopropylmalate dehydrogenase, partial [Devosia sp.]|nr:3-isopropylmalate dehydrogenase [Devosia sp.]
MVKRHHTPLRSSKQDIEQIRKVPRTAQTEAPAYRLAFSDEEFMTSDELRGVRFQLEYLKPELWLQERGVNSTIVLFGGARIPAPGQDPWAAKTAIARENLKKSSRYYDEAR